MIASLCVVISLSTQFDLVIKSGRVVDGTGSPAVYRDIGIIDGKVAEVGRIDATQGKRTIDATGLTVAPGFIDVHTHAEDIKGVPDSQNFVRMGVTTAVLGNCGSSALDTKRYLAEVDAAKPVINVATLIGHNTVRREAMGGNIDRVPTEAELEQMKGMVRSALKGGAIGISTGLIYLPGTFAKTEEIIELAKVAAEFGGIYASHMRDEGLEMHRSIEETCRIAREAKLPVHISHIKLSGKSAWGRAAAMLELIEQARADGVDITQDQYAYTASSTGISQLVPEWAREGGKLRERLASNETRARIVNEMKERLKRRGQDDYSYAVIASCSQDPSLNGLSIPEAAQKRAGSALLEAQIDTVLELVSAGSPLGVFHGMSEEDLQAFMRHRNTMFASDSGVRLFLQGVPHPRGYGNNARILGRYVREERVLELEEAVRRMTSLPASVFRLSGRGQVREGFQADLVIFNAATVKDLATYSEPHQFPSGIEYVLVNGAVTIDKRQFTGAREGQALRLNGSHRSSTAR